MVTRPYPEGPRHARVVHTLGQRIVTGELDPGNPLPTEEQLVAELGVGRSAVREGVKVLAGKGLLASRTSAGTRVRPRDSWNLLDPDVLSWRFVPTPEPRDVRMLADLRIALEPGAARVAAERADAEGVRGIDEALAALYATADDPDAFIEADLGFHRAVFAASGNDLLLYIYEMISIALRSVRQVHTRAIAHNKETLPNHERVAVAIRRHHHRKAEEAMRDVVEVARADAEQHIRLCCGG
ncbi:DNA-binding FadR family transcriptional regulator [Streptosporangium becharense]|uniref:DNA-binding FadR family transcriptional regulator n=1 Tax=Streptosporangium becharense TaxID=1816182 RepID=A0A7W9MJC4_9ACTN|nr:FadR/GntR family transcriptional regulator [Streptosporangium becharense]MBB2910349.1 DNA-binding FadR family transcriptional regulator [Streptosporangium becharense]MBB5823092.1 DNA-binding FadR family transcriptional regulator [Streptosporangium becharense]